MWYSVDMRHWPEFGIVTTFWIRGTGLIWVKRHWPEFGIVPMLWIRGTGLFWYYYNVFMEALAVLSCSGRSIFTACDCFWRFIFSIISFVFSLQMFVSDHG